MTHPNPVIPKTIEVDISQSNGSPAAMKNTISELTESLRRAEEKIAQLSDQSTADQEALEHKNNLLDKLKVDQISDKKTIAELTEDKRQMREELTSAYRTRDTLGAFLAKFWESAFFVFSRPALLVARTFGWLDRGMDHLIPLNETHRDANGTWHGTGYPQFLIPTVPLDGWVRVRAKVKSSVTSRACLYFDTGKAFHEGEYSILSPVAGVTEIDRIFYLRSPTYLIRFDPVQAPGKFSVESFSLQPLSRLSITFAAIKRNIKTALGGIGTHRPSVLLGLQLLLRGQWSKFYLQLLSNAQINTSVSEYDLWRRRHFITEADRRKMRDQMARWENPPKFSVITPVYNLPEVYLRKCIDSVLNQIYPNWELCLADDASPDDHIKTVLNEYAAKDPRIKVIFQPNNGGISEASNAAFALATGNYIAMLDHDDELSEHALFKMAEAIMNDPSLDMIYSDEDKITSADMHFEPFFKPDWSPEYFLACMYTCHLGVFRTELVKKLGGWRKQFDGSQDYDLVLRVIATEPKIHHIPDVLYHWRTLPTSTAFSAAAKPDAHYRAADAIQDYLDQTGREGWVEDGYSTGFHRVRFKIKCEPKVSIVIPSACRPIEIDGRQTWLALECVSSIRQLSTYKNVEIIVLDDNRMSDELQSALKKLDVRRVPFEGEFNFSSKINLGCQSATGIHLVTMNDDVSVIEPDWIQAMLEYSQLPEIGAVGAQLLFPDNTRQHCGITIQEGRPGHVFYTFPGDNTGYYNSSVAHRNYSAVTAACMMTRADVFKAVGGFNEKLPLNYNDVDYCLKVRNLGKRIVYMPYAKLYHSESATKTGTYSHELEEFKKTWGNRIAVDPYYNPNLTMDTGDFRIG